MTSKHGGRLRPGYDHTEKVKNCNYEKFGNDGQKIGKALQLF